MLKKLKVIVSSYNREVAKLNTQTVKIPANRNITNVEKYINNCNNMMNTNSIFY